MIIASPELRSARAEDNRFVPRPGFEPFRLEETERSIASRFRDVARKRGRATAIVDGRTHVTYSDLLSQASSIAAFLRAHLGAAHGPLVLQCPIGAAAIEALLGVLFAGRAYLFVDRATPADEIDRIVTAAAPAALIVSDSASPMSQASVREGTVPLFTVDRLRAAVIHATEVEPDSEPGDAACLFATSGSTGAPKLVALTHRAVLFDIGRQINDLYLGPDDRFDLLFSLAFSASLAPVFGALLTGGELHVLDAREHLTALARWIDRSQISVSTMTVSTMRAICASVAAGDLSPRPRLVSVGGEPLLSKDVEAFDAAFHPSSVLQNAMAATETRTYAQYFVPRSWRGQGPVPIGWPVAGKDVLVLGTDGAPLVPGESGEIAVRSRFLASGYVNDPALTARRFLAQDEGSVLFRTGDRGRFREDGCLLFLGRVDSIVKIRGYRVDPEAVEAALGRHDRVSHSVVVVSEAVRGEPILAAYVVPRREAPVAADELRAYLAAELPPYLVPTSITILESLPITRNGKVDRRALPPPQGDMPLRAASIPTDQSTTGALIEIWKQVLRRSDVEPRDDFFDCGGDSLSALRLRVHIHEWLDIDLPLEVLVEHPTVGRLAAWLDVEKKRGPRERRALVPLQANGTGIPLFCVPGIGGDPQRYRALVRSLDFCRPVYSFRGGLGVVDRDLDSSIETLAASFVSEMDVALRPDWPVMLCGHSFGALVAFEMARQLQAAGRRVGLLVIIDTPLVVGDARHAAARLRDVLMNLPDWVRDDVLTSGLRRIAIRGLGKTEMIWQRVRGIASAKPSARELNVRAYFGVMDVPPQYMALINRRYRAAIEYKPPAQSYSGKVALFRARSQPLTGRRDRHLGWDWLTAEPVEVYDVPGHHESCLVEPHVHRLAELLRVRLEAVER